MNIHAKETIESYGFTSNLGHWQAFKEFAEHQGISLEHVDDWGPWLFAFMAGAEFEAIRG